MAKLQDLTMKFLALSTGGLGGNPSDIAQKFVDDIKEPFEQLRNSLNPKMIGKDLIVGMGLGGIMPLVQTIFKTTAVSLRETNRENNENSDNDSFLMNVTMSENLILIKDKLSEILNQLKVNDPNKKLTDLSEPFVLANDNLSDINSTLAEMLEDQRTESAAEIERRREEEAANRSSGGIGIDGDSGSEGSGKKSRLSFIANIGAGIAKFVGKIGLVFSKLFGVFTKLLKFGGPIALLVAGFASLNALDWENTFGKVSKVVDDFMNGDILSALGGIADVITDLPMRMIGRLTASVFDFFGGTEIANAINDFLDTNENIWVGLWEMFSEWFSGIFDFENIKETIDGLIPDWMKDIGTWFYDNTIGIWANVATSLFEGDLKGAITNLVPPWVRNLGKWFYDNGIKPVVDWFTETFTVENVKDAFVKAISTYASFLLNIGTWFYDNAIKPVVDFLSPIFDFDFKQKLISLLGEDNARWLLDLGQHVYDNTIKPIIDFLSPIFNLDVVGYLKSKVPNWAKPYLGISDDEPKEEISEEKQAILNKIQTLENEKQAIISEIAVAGHNPAADAREREIDTELRELNNMLMNPDSQQNRSAPNIFNDDGENTWQGRSYGMPPSEPLKIENWNDEVISEEDANNQAIEWANRQKKESDKPRSTRLQLPSPSPLINDPLNFITPAPLSGDTQKMISEAASHAANIGESLTRDFVRGGDSTVRVPVITESDKPRLGRLLPSPTPLPDQYLDAVAASPVSAETTTMMRSFSGEISNTLDPITRPIPELGSQQSSGSQTVIGAVNVNSNNVQAAPAAQPQRSNTPSSTTPSPSPTQKVIDRQLGISNRDFYGF